MTNLKTSKFDFYYDFNRATSELTYLLILYKDSLKIYAYNNDILIFDNTY
jgi:hypothetical protein